jgi:hypothetical protein
VSIGEVILLVVGLAAVVFVIDAAVRTFVVPRAIPVTFTYVVFRSVRKTLAAFAPAKYGYERRDRVMALYAPLALLILPTVSLLVIFGGYTAAYYATEHDGWRHALTTSGSSLLTLGFDRPQTMPGTLLSFSEAAIGLGLLALVIAYLPTIYNGFSHREIMVTELSVRAGTPATAWEMLERAHVAGYLHEMDPVWQAWLAWFTELSETHTSLSALPFFRSPNPHRSWITASGTILDAAAFRMSVVQMPFSAAAGLCIRSGYLALRAIADSFGFVYDADPRPDDPISISRDEFDGIYDRLAVAGVPVRPDRDRAWEDFAGWRVNYDAVLVTLAAFVMAPYGPWSSDRSLRTPLPRRSPLRRQAQRLRTAGRRSTTT